MKCCEILLIKQVEKLPFSRGAWMTSRKAIHLNKSYEFSSFINVYVMILIQNLYLILLWNIDIFEYCIYINKKVYIYIWNFILLP